MTIKKEKIATELLKNTTNEYLRSLLSDYMNSISTAELSLDESRDKDETLDKLGYCVDYIGLVDFNVSGWGLHEIPTNYCYVFSNKKENKMFDLATWGVGDVIPRFINNNCCEENAKTIENAIERYSHF